MEQPEKEGKKIVSATKLCTVLKEFENQEGELTAYQIALAYKAALSDFVCRKVSRHASQEVQAYLDGALKSRARVLEEETQSSVMKVANYY